MKTPLVFKVKTIVWLLKAQRFSDHYQPLGVKAAAFMHMTVERTVALDSTNGMELKMEMGG